MKIVFGAAFIFVSLFILIFSIGYARELRADIKRGTKTDAVALIGFPCLFMGIFLITLAPGIILIREGIAK